MACYKFAKGTVASSYVFPTDCGWLYSVLFINTSTEFVSNPLLYNNSLVFDFQFDCTALDEKPNKRKDKFVAESISQIFLEHTSENGIFSIYFFTCLPDGKDAARAKLFNDWYDEFDTENWQLINYQLIDPDDNNRMYYAGLLIHNSHPYFEEILLAFEDYINTSSRNKIPNRD
jgi:hypothetical protein